MASGLLRVVLLWMIASVAIASGPAAVRKQVESSMLVTGAIDIKADGRVGGFQLDKRESLSEAVAGLIDRSIPLWRFEPMRVQGQPVSAKARMSLRVVAKKQNDDQFLLDIRSASFDAGSRTSGEAIKGIAMTPPKYPETAYRMGVKGTVYLIVRINPQGTVDDVFTEQVNLKVVGNEKQMARGRDLLGKSAMQAAKSWTFDVPTGTDDEFWTVRVPVAYAWQDDRLPQYGEWETYVPGPTQKAPWILEEIDESFSPDAQIAGSVQEVGNGPQLLTQLTRN